MNYRLLTALSVFALLWAGIASAESGPTGNCLISGGTNNGIQIQNCPIIEQAPTPSFHVVTETPVTKDASGNYTRTITVEIDAPYVPGNMVVFVKGPTVTGLNVSTKNVMASGNGKTSDDIYYWVVGTPWGQYTITVTTTDEKSQPGMQIEFNHH